MFKRAKCGQLLRILSVDVTGKVRKYGIVVFNVPLDTL